MKCIMLYSKHIPNIKRQQINKINLSLLLLISCSLFKSADTVSSSNWLQSCSVCYCSWNSGKKTGDCRGKSLDQLPENLTSELQVIDFSDNNIVCLKDEVFLRANLQNLQKVYLQNCSILEVNKNAFKDLRILIELDISHNKIRKLHPDLFQGLLKLRNIIINANEIENLENNLFTKLPSLSRVELKRNQLKHVAISAFGRLPMLSEVFLEVNELKFLQKNTFINSPRLSQLSLNENPWNCTCELEDFREYVVHNRLLRQSIDCKSPDNLKGKLWNEISEKFSCKPKVIETSVNLVKDSSKKLILLCRILGSPEPNIIWKHNKTVINGKDYRFKIYNVLEKNNLPGPKSIKSELHISDAIDNDNGVYTCIAKNHGGRADANFVINKQRLMPSTDDDKLSLPKSKVTADITFTMLLGLTIIVVSIVFSVIAYFGYQVKKIKKQRSTEIAVENETNKTLLEKPIEMKNAEILSKVNPVEKPQRLDKKTAKEDICVPNNIGICKGFRDHVRVSRLDDDLLTYRSSCFDENLPPDLLSFSTHIAPEENYQKNYGITPNIDKLKKYRSRNLIDCENISIPKTITPILATEANFPYNVSSTHPSTDGTLSRKSYMTIPRKTNTKNANLSNHQSVKSHCPDNFLCDVERVAFLLNEPVYDNLGLRTTVGGNSSTNLDKSNECRNLMFSMRNRPLPATPTLIDFDETKLEMKQRMYPDSSSLGTYSFFGGSYNEIGKAYDRVKTNSEDAKITNSTRMKNKDLEILRLSTKIPPTPPPKPAKSNLKSTHNFGGTEV